MATMRFCINREGSLTLLRQAFLRRRGDTAATSGMTDCTIAQSRREVYSLILGCPTCIDFISGPSVGIGG